MNLSFSAELLKLRKRWATWIIAILYILFVAAFVYVLPLIGFKTSENSRMPDEVRNSLAQGLTLQRLPYQTTSFLVTLGGALALIFGALVSASEYGWNTVKTILTLRPGRLSIFFGKLAAVLVTLVIYVVLSYITAIVLSIITSNAAGIQPGALDLGDLLKGSGIALLILSAWTALAIFLGVLFQGTAWAIGIGLVYALIIENLIVGLSNVISWLENVPKFLLAQNSSALAKVLPSGNEAQGIFSGGGQPSISGGHAIIVLAAWLIISLAIALIFFYRRDVT